MSLTSELKKADSPISAFINGISAPLTATYGNSRSSQLAAQKLGFTELISDDVVVPLKPDVDAPRSGTAFDIRTRMALGAFALESSSSAMGIDRMVSQASVIQNGAHRARMMVELYEEAQRLLLAAPTEDDLDLASLLLSPSEQFFRANTNALTGSLGDALDTANGQAFIENLYSGAVADIRNLRIANAEQIVAWREQIDAGGLFEGNPAFAGSLLIGGADGDWLVGETLIDCKVYAKLTVPKLRDFLRQLLGYVMLDLDDALKIRSVGVWLPRQTTMRVWSLKALLGGDPEALLPKLREDFVKSTQHNQVVVHVPVTEQRKLQLVTDNRFSPWAMLRTLALSDDKDLRMRVARNENTPVDVICMLSEDRYAAVRERVASNGSTPLDVLHRLSNDKSVAVRRAASGNPGAMPAASAVAAIGTTPGAELVIAAPRVDSSREPTSLEILRDRDPDAIDFELLWNIFSAMHADGTVDASALKLPDATQVFGWRTGRKPVVPKQLRRGLPNHVLEAMLEPARPPHLRRMAASLLPIEDPVIRGRLLADVDVEIRWRALRRSQNCVDEEMSGFLVALSASREARVEFSTAGVPRQDRWKRPAEYDEDALEVIAAHWATPQKVLHELTSQKLPAVLIGLAGNPSLKDEGLSLLSERMMQMTSTDARLMFAWSHACPTAVLEHLATNRSAEIRIAVAGNSHTPETVIAHLAQDQDLAVRIAVLRNRSSSAALVAGMAEHLLAALQDDPLLDALRGYSWRDDVELPDELIEDALDRLSKSRVQDSGIRSFVASNGRTSPATLARLANSSVENLRLAVAGNIRTAHETLNKLLRDESMAVRVRAARSVEVNAEPDDTNEEAPAAELEVAARPSITVADLHEMVASKRADVRKQAAYSSAVTPDMLTFLAGDRRSVIVRRIVAANPATPSTTLRSLASESDAQITQSIAFNPGTPIDVLADLAGRSLDLALLVALNPDAPDEILGALVDDDDPLIKYVAQEVAANRPSLAPGARHGAQREVSTPDQ